MASLNLAVEVPVADGDVRSRDDLASMVWVGGERRERAADPRAHVLRAGRELRAFSASLSAPSAKKRDSHRADHADSELFPAEWGTALVIWNTRETAAMLPTRDVHTESRRTSRRRSVC